LFCDSKSVVVQVDHIDLYGRDQDGWGKIVIRQFDHR